MARTNWDSNEIVQRLQPSIPALSVGSTDIVLTWPQPFADTTYCVVMTVEAAAATIGGMVPGIKTGTKTTTGCTITLYNNLLISLSAGGVVHVAATGSI
jgi:hypothetical protein